MPPFKILQNSKKFSQHLASLYLDGWKGEDFEKKINKQYLQDNGFLSKLDAENIQDVKVIVKDVDAPEKKLKLNDTHYIGHMEVTEAGLNIYIPCPERDKLKTFKEEEVKKWIENNNPNEFRVPDAFCIYTTG